MNEKIYLVENKAKVLYLKGAELEQNNHYYDAVKYYRKAVQLVPDIDIKIIKESKLKDVFHSIEPKGNISTEESRSDCETDEEYDGSEPLTDRIRRITEKSDKICVQNKSQKSFHFSDLPLEMVSYIFKWVVSDELDLRSLEQCSLVCRGFYLCARDPQIWKSACARMWKTESMNLLNYDSWREMFINRLRISTNGCYIGETKYYRPGEISFQDETYRPYHLVVYYRYLRFFADEKVIMINTPEIPSAIVSQLKTQNSKLGAIFFGSYKIVDDFVYAVFKPKKVLKNNVKSQYVDLSYNMTFQMKKYKKWKTKLLWKEYKVSCANQGNYEDNFEVKEHLFPPLRFSRVKSYTAESERSLM